MENTRKSRMPEIVVGVILLVVFGGAFATMLSMYFSENDKKYAIVTDAAALGPDYLEVRTVVTGVDPIKGEVTARLRFEPHGALKGEDEFSLSRDLTVYVNASKGKQFETFKKGTHPMPLDVTLDLYGGEATNYPFDAHQCDLDIAVTAVAPPKPVEPPPAPTEPAAEGAEATDTPKPAEKKEEKKDEKKTASVTDLLEGEPVKTAIGVEAALTGFRIVPSKSDEAADIGYVGVDLAVSRTPTVKIFSIFIMTCFWALAMTILSLTWAVTFRERKLEFAMFTFMAGMLFAFPAVRNLQPGIPPLGTLTDFLSLFWAQGIIVVCLVTLLGVWLTRK